MSNVIEVQVHGKTPGTAKTEVKCRASLEGERFSEKGMPHNVSSQLAEKSDLLEGCNPEARLRGATVEEF